MFFGCACLLAGGWSASAQQHLDFGYSGAKRPPHGGGISEHWAARSDGRNQSPVDLSRTTTADLAPIDINYPTFAAEVINNGHTIQVNHRPAAR